MMSESSEILVDSIPDGTTKVVLKEILSRSLRPGSSQIQYILLPWEEDPSRALVGITGHYPEDLLDRMAEATRNSGLKITPAPKQTFNKCMADVDALIVASLPDVARCAAELRAEYGIDAAHSPETGRLTISGSLPQLQAAQTRLNEIHQHECQLQHAQMREIERRAATGGEEIEMGNNKTDRGGTDKGEKRRGVAAGGSLHGKESLRGNREEVKGTAGASRAAVADSRETELLRPSPVYSTGPPAAIPQGSSYMQEVRRKLLQTGGGKNPTESERNAGGLTDAGARKQEVRSRKEEGASVDSFHRAKQCDLLSDVDRRSRYDLTATSSSLSARTTIGRAEDDFVTGRSQDVQEHSRRKEDNILARSCHDDEAAGREGGTREARCEDVEKTSRLHSHNYDRSPIRADLYSDTNSSRYRVGNAYKSLDAYKSALDPAAADDYGSRLDVTTYGRPVAVGSGGVYGTSLVPRSVHAVRPFSSASAYGSETRPMYGYDVTRRDLVSDRPMGRDLRLTYPTLSSTFNGRTQVSSSAFDRPYTRPAAIEAASTPRYDWKTNYRSLRYDLDQTDRDLYDFDRQNLLSPHGRSRENKERYHREETVSSSGSEGNYLVARKESESPKAFARSGPTSLPVGMYSASAETFEDANRECGYSSRSQHRSRKSSSPSKREDKSNAGGISAENLLHNSIGNEWQSAQASSHDVEAARQKKSAELKFVSDYAKSARMGLSANPPQGTKKSTALADNRSGTKSAVGTERAEKNPEDSVSTSLVLSNSRNFASLPIGAAYNGSRSNDLGRENSGKLSSGPESWSIHEGFGRPEEQSWLSSVGSSLQRPRRDIVSVDEFLQGVSETNASKGPGVERGEYGKQMPVTSHGDTSNAQLEPLGSRAEPKQQTKSGASGEKEAKKEETLLYLDYFVVSYLHQVLRDRLNDIEAHYDVRISCKDRISDDLITVAFESSGNSRSEENRASEAFAELFEDTFHCIVQRTVAIGNGVSEKHVVNESRDLHGRYGDELIALVDYPLSVVLVGRFEAVTTAADDLRRSVGERLGEGSGSGRGIVAYTDSDDVTEKEEELMEIDEDFETLGNDERRRADYIGRRGDDVMMGGDDVRERPGGVVPRKYPDADVQKKPSGDVRNYRSLDVKEYPGTDGGKYPGADVRKNPADARKYPNSEAGKYPRADAEKFPGAVIGYNKARSHLQSPSVAQASPRSMSPDQARALELVARHIESAATIDELTKALYKENKARSGHLEEGENQQKSDDIRKNTACFKSPEKEIDSQQFDIYEKNRRLDLESKQNQSKGHEDNVHGRQGEGHRMEPDQRGNRDLESTGDKLRRNRGALIDDDALRHSKERENRDRDRIGERNADRRTDDLTLELRRSLKLNNTSLGSRQDERKIREDERDVKIYHQLENSAHHRDKFTTRDEHYSHRDESSRDVEDSRHEKNQTSLTAVPSGATQSGTSRLDSDWRAKDSESTERSWVQRQRLDATTAYRCRFGDRLTVSVRTDDITRLRVDAIVNAANGLLKNYAGVARAIEALGGEGFAQECEDYIAKNGPLKDGEVAHTRGCGELRCADVIHAVGPMWDAYDDKEKCAAVLQRTYTRVLCSADEVLRAASLAVPAISTGIFNVPLDVCARAIYCAMRDFVADAQHSHSTLRDVHIVNKDQDATDVIHIVFQQLSEAEESGSAGVSRSVGDSGGESWKVGGSAEEPRSVGGSAGTAAGPIPSSGRGNATGTNAGAVHSVFESAARSHRTKTKRESDTSPSSRASSHHHHRHHSTAEDAKPSGISEQSKSTRGINHSAIPRSIEKNLLHETGCQKTDRGVDRGTTAIDTRTMSCNTEEMDRGVRRNHAKDDDDDKPVVRVKVEPRGGSRGNEEGRGGGRSLPMSKCKFVPISSRENADDSDSI